MSNSSIWPIDRTLSGATTLGQSGPGSDDNEGVLHIPQNSSITGTSPSDCLVSHPENLSYSSAEMQSVYSTGPADWAVKNWNLTIKISIAKNGITLSCKHINFLLCTVRKRNYLSIWIIIYNIYPLALMATIN